MKPKDKFKFMLKEFVFPILKDKGFRKKNHVFVRELTDIIQIINFAPSGWNMPEYNDFSLEFALFSKGYFRVLGKEAPKSWFNYAYFSPVVGGGIQRLAEPGVYFSDYRIDSDTDIEEMAIRIEQKLVEYLIPFVESNRTIEDVITTIESGFASLYHTIPLYLILGKKDLAQHKLEEAWQIQGNEYYKPMLVDIATRLELQVSHLK